MLSFFFQHKFLALYFHNQETEFSKHFCDLISNNEEVKNLLDSHFIIHGLDVGEDTYQENLIEELGNFFQLIPCIDMVKKKQATIFFIAVVDMNIEICSVVKDIQSLSNISTTMSILIETILYNDEESYETTQTCNEDNRSVLYDVP